MFRYPCCPVRRSLRRVLLLAIVQLAVALCLAWPADPVRADALIDLDGRDRSDSPKASVLALSESDRRIRTAGSDAIGDHRRIEEKTAPAALDIIDDWILRPSAEAWASPARPPRRRLSLRWS